MEASWIPPSMGRWVRSLGERQLFLLWGDMWGWQVQKKMKALIWKSMGNGISRTSDLGIRKATNEYTGSDVSWNHLKQCICNGVFQLQYFSCDNYSQSDCSWQTLKNENLEYVIRPSSFGSPRGSWCDLIRNRHLEWSTSWSRALFWQARLSTTTACIWLKYRNCGILAASNCSNDAKEKDIKEETTISGLCGLCSRQNQNLSFLFHY